MESILVTPEQLKNVANEVDNLAAEYYSKYENLLNQVAEFNAKDYRGTEGDAFHAKVEEFRDDFLKMKNLMNDYAKHLRDAATNYSTTQDNNINQIKGLQA